MPTDLKVITVKLPKADLRRFPTDISRSAFIRTAVAEKLEREGLPAWRPKTQLGNKLLALSDRYHGERLDVAEMSEELRERRDGVD
jgi:Arc/MetJ-type ribon-helix-helix transcriptional regulator